jgi:hypothetical protein
MIVLLVLASSVAELVRVPPKLRFSAGRNSNGPVDAIQELHVRRISGIEYTNQSDLESANTTVIPAQAKLKGAS